jgi:DNA-binding NarL/FixJ family response regulator
LKTESAPTLEALPELSPRRMEALKLVARGFTQKEAARLMGASQRTVEAHLIAVREAWNVSSTIEAAVMAAKRGML